MDKRTGPRKKALQIIKYFRHENPDYNYLRTVFQHLRKELNVAVTAESKKLPYVPTEAELKKFPKEKTSSIFFRFHDFNRFCLVRHKNKVKKP